MKKFLIVFLIFGTTKADRFANYSELPYDEHMAVNVRVMENRSSLIQTYNSVSYTHLTLPTT